MASLLGLCLGLVEWSVRSGSDFLGIPHAGITSSKAYPMYINNGNVVVEHDAEVPIAKLDVPITSASASEDRVPVAILDDDDIDALPEAEASLLEPAEDMDYRLTETIGVHVLDEAILDVGLPVIDGDKSCSYPFQGHVIAAVNNYVRQHATGDWGYFESYMINKAEELRQRLFPENFELPMIKIGKPSSPRILWGEYRQRGDHGLVGEIIINERMFTDEVHGVVCDHKEPIGFLRFLDDVLLHQMAHAYQHLVLKQPEESYRGHGTRFAQLCNDIGERLDLAPVRHAKSKKKDEFLRPSCAEWPQCVRPIEHYLGAYDPSPKQISADQPQASVLLELLNHGSMGPAEAWQTLADLAANCPATTDGYKMLALGAVKLMRLQVKQATDRLRHFPSEIPLPTLAGDMAKAG